MRELYLLPRWEQRALLLLSLLLLLGIAVRVSVQQFTVRDPPDMEDFIGETRAILAAFDEADSLKKSAGPPAGALEKVVSPPIPGNPGSRRQFPPHPVDINRADSAQLLPLPGIGPVFAGRIVRYRNLLGGFVSASQLEEVYGLKPQTVREISDFLIIDTSAIRRIHLDTSSFRNMLRHPYLGIEEVKALMLFRDFRARTGSREAWDVSAVLPDSTLERVLPYLQFDH